MDIDWWGRFVIQLGTIGGNKNPFSQNFLDIEEETALEMIYLRNYAEAHFQTFLLQIAIVRSTKWKLNFVRDAAR